MKPGGATRLSTVKSRFSENNKSRRTLHTLQPAATDKENLVGGSRVLRSSTGPLKALVKDEMSAKTKIEIAPLEKSKKSTDVKKTKKVSSPNKNSKDKPRKVARGEKIVIEADDLTSEAGPSEKYWEVLAERRRKALNDALEENQELHARVKKLEEENHLYKEMLDESRALVEVLQEMIGEDRPDINNSLDDSAL